LLFSSRCAARCASFFNVGYCTRVGYFFTSPNCICGERIFCSFLLSSCNLVRSCVAVFFTGGLGAATEDGCVESLEEDLTGGRGRALHR